MIRRTDRSSGSGPRPSLFKTAVLAVGDLYDRAVDSVLIRPHDIGTADEAMALAHSDFAWNADALTDQVRKVALVVLPLLRRTGMIARAPGLRRVPSIAVATTFAAVSTQLWSGVKELQILAALVATRLRRAGYPDDAPLVKRLAIELYTHPERQPTLTSVPSSISRAMARWTVAGVFGRNTTNRARLAFVAAEQLDLDAVMAQWQNPPNPRLRRSDSPER
jgi:hypothetical protein